MKPRREAGKVVTGLEESAEKEVGDNYASTGTLLMSEVFEKVTEIKIVFVAFRSIMLLLRFRTSVVRS